jgi:hypothetical protein
MSPDNHDAVKNGRRIFARRGSLPVPDFDELHRYNAEVQRGIVHTEEWRARMAPLQARWDEWREKAFRP